MRRGPAILLFAVVAVAGSALLPVLRPPPFHFDVEGIDLPLLRVRSRDWEHERWKAVLVIRGDERRFHLSYRAEGGGARPGEIPWPEGLETGTPTWFTRLGNLLRGRPVEFVSTDRPAVLICMDADAPWQQEMLGDRVSARFARVYLAGRRPDGSIGAIPYRTETHRAMVRFGSSLVPSDLGTRGLDLRVTREGGRVRYRWDNGAATLPDDVLRRPGRSPVLPGLVRSIRSRKPLLRCIPVVLRVGWGVRYVDVLRAVECAEGDSSVLFIDHAASVDAKLPAVHDPDLVRFVDDACEWPEWPHRVIVSANGDLSQKAAWLAHHALVLHADERAPFRVCLLLIRRAWKADRGVYLEVSLGEPGIDYVRPVYLPPPCDGAVDMRGLPEDATVGEVIHAVLRHLKAGATGFRFE